jgi:arylsulfatase A-like enzyme
MTNKPNIIFITTDQQSWNHIGAYGNKHLVTPNIDRIIQNGVSFMRSYCTDPVCGPSRSSWATGLYSSETGVSFNDWAIHEDIPDLGQILNANGYNAYHTGKWHVEGRDVRTSFKCLYFGKRNIPAGGAEIYDPITTRSVLDFLSRYEENKPFYLQIGLINPHDICEYQHSHEQRHIPDGVAQGFLTDEDLPPLPDNFHYDTRETVTQIVMRRGKDPVFHKPVMNAADKWTKRQWRYHSWQFYRFVEKVDLQIGLILSALEASPFKDNTLIIFSSDHGEASGSHQMLQKFTLYEESIRTPFVVASLGEQFEIKKGRRDETHFISGVDILPTVLDYAGVNPPAHISGQSVRPLVENRDVDWRKFAYVESSCWGRAIVSDRYKFVTEYVPQEGETTIPGPDAERLGLEQLFDLENDPSETANLASEKRHAELLSEFRRRLLDYETRLHRRPLREIGRRTMQVWGKRITAYWTNHPELR